MTDHNACDRIAERIQSESKKFSDNIMSSSNPVSLLQSIIIAVDAIFNDIASMFDDLDDGNSSQLHDTMAPLKEIREQAFDLLDKLTIDSPK